MKCLWPNLKHLFSRRKASQNIYDLRNSETDLVKKPENGISKENIWIQWSNSME